MKKAITLVIGVAAIGALIIEAIEVKKSITKIDKRINAREKALQEYSIHIKRADDMYEESERLKDLGNIEEAQKLEKEASNMLTLAVNAYFDKLKQIEEEEEEEK